MRMEGNIINVYREVKALVLFTRIRKKKLRGRELTFTEWNKCYSARSQLDAMRLKLNVIISKLVKIFTPRNLNHILIDHFIHSDNSNFHSGPECKQSSANGAEHNNVIKDRNYITQLLQLLGSPSDRASSLALRA